MPKTKQSIFGYLLVAALLLAACSSEVAALEITLVARDIEWSATEYEASVGQEILITVTNEGYLDHNLIIESHAIDVDLPPGATETVSFLASEPGVIEFYCSVPGHVDAGMKGTITINP
ncbi:MAG: cupredoxin domain-containing protein [Anaerolineae bacterium]|nr:cupredoxin domain-containing protein [Anaerolineae bacterium]